MYMHLISGKFINICLLLMRIDIRKNSINLRNQRTQHCVVSKFSFRCIRDIDGYCQKIAEMYPLEILYADIDQ